MDNHLKEYVNFTKFMYPIAESYTSLVDKYINYDTKNIDKHRETCLKNKKKRQSKKRNR